MQKSTLDAARGRIGLRDEAIGAAGSGVVGAVGLIAVLEMLGAGDLRGLDRKILFPRLIETHVA
jgi:hypothetical protein